MKRRNFLKLFGLALVAPKAVGSFFKKAEEIQPFPFFTYDNLTDDTAWFLKPDHVEYSQAVAKIKRMSPKGRKFVDGYIKNLAIETQKRKEHQAAEVFNNAFKTRYRS